MSFLSAILLGLVQGITEFLPVSNSGHMVILEAFFHLSAPDELWDVFLRFGSLIAVLVVFRSELARSTHLLLRKPSGRRRTQMQRERRPARRLVLMIVTATIPLILALPIRTQLDALSQNTLFVGCMLLIAGGVLYWSARYSRGRKTEREMTIGDAILVGLGQLLAVIPGLSRSGFTISAGLLRGLDQEFSVRFSLLLYIPAVLLANIIRLIGAVQAGASWSLLPQCLVGMLAAAVVGVMAIRFLQMLARRSNFGGFAWYCWGAGLLTLILSMFS